MPPPWPVCVDATAVVLSFLPKPVGAAERRATFGLRGLGRVWCAAFSRAVRCGWTLAPADAEVDAAHLADAVAAGLGGATSPSDALLWACGVGVLRPCAALCHAAETGDVALFEAMDDRVERLDTRRLLGLVQVAGACGHVPVLRRLLWPYRLLSTSWPGRWSPRRTLKRASVGDR